MALFTSRTRITTVPELIARRKYHEALELLKDQMKQKPEDVQLRLQSADVLVMLGMVENATRVLSSVADDLASGGFAAKAVAVLKKIQRLDPERKDIEKRIVDVFKEKVPPPLAVPELSFDREDEVRRSVPGAAGEGTDSSVAPEEDWEFSSSADLDIGMELEISLPPESSAASPLPSVDSRKAEADLEFFESPRGQGARSRRVASPLFDDFAEDEMLEFVRGLELLHHESGDIVVTEGEPGDSLYVITTGIVKAFVRNAEGASRLVRQLGEGDFFGEISVLSGMPRTATITAAGECELLRLSRAALDDITSRKPSVRAVLQRFYDERANSAAERSQRDDVLALL